MLTNRSHFLLSACLVLLGLSACQSISPADVGAEAPRKDDLLAITAAGVSRLSAGTSYSESAVEEALPGYDASIITMATETKTQSALAVFKDGLQVLQILPGQGKSIGTIHGVSERLRGPNGERIGMTFREARATRSACREGRGNWAGMPICTASGAPDVTLVFAIPGYSNPNGLPDDATLANATLQRLIWTAPGEGAS